MIGPAKHVDDSRQQHANERVGHSKWLTCIGHQLDALMLLPDGLSSCALQVDEVVDGNAQIRQEADECDQASKGATDLAQNRSQDERNNVDGDDGTKVDQESEETLSVFGWPTTYGRDGAVGGTSDWLGCTLPLGSIPIPVSTGGISAA